MRKPTKNIKALTLPIAVIFLMLVMSVLFPFVQAENIDLNENDYKITIPDRVGILNSGYHVFKYVKNSTDDYFVEFSQQIPFFNRCNVSVNFTITVEPYHTSRVHSVIRDNYTFNPWPFVHWFTIDNSIRVDPDCKNYLPYTINITSEYLNNLKNGLVAYIICKPDSGSLIDDTLIITVPKFKVFLSIYDEETENSIIENMGIDPAAARIDYFGFNSVLIISVLFSIVLISVYIVIHRWNKPFPSLSILKKKSVYQEWKNESFSEVTDQIDESLRRNDKL